MDRRLTSRAVDHSELIDAVRELQTASKRAWLECETDELLKLLDHHEIRIEVWIREPGHSIEPLDLDNY